MFVYVYYTTQGWLPCNAGFRPDAGKLRLGSPFLPGDESRMYWVYDRYIRCNDRAEVCAQSNEEGQPQENRPVDGCDATFTNRGSIHGHTGIFHGDTPILICEECGQSFKSISNLNAHLQTHLSRENREEYICEEEGCGKSFVTKTGLQRHWDSKHSEEGSEEQQAFLAYRTR